MTDINEAMHRFYKLKSEYDDKYKKFIESIINNKALSKSEKQKKMSTFKKKCVICGKEGGSIFDINENTLLAKCGNTLKPCGFHIEIKRGEYIPLEEAINDFEEDVNDDKISIIRNKLDLLFGYQDLTVMQTKFEKQKELYEENSTIYREELKRLKDVQNNSMKKIEIKKQNLEIYVLIEKIKQLIKDYNTNLKDSYIKDLIMIYNEDLVPLLKKNITTKYPVNRIDYDDENSTYHLVQRKYSLNETIDELSEPEVIKFNVVK